MKLISKSAKQSLQLCLLTVLLIILATSLCSAQEHLHPVCGESCNDGANHVDVLTWTSVTASNINTALNTSGNYYLAEDIQLNAMIDITTPNAVVHLCLNGHVLKANGEWRPIRTEANRNVTLTICDCQPENTEGSLSSARTLTSPVDDSKIEIAGGLITGGHYDSETAYGGGIILNNATLDLYGGTIGGNSVTHGGGIYLNGATFTMHAGTICCNEAVENPNADGGGVAFDMGKINTFQLKGGTISHNKAGRNGGGVSLTAFTESSKFTLSGNATVEHNSAVYGGGIYCYFVEFTMEGGFIRNNQTKQYGGGIYLSNPKATLTGGEITGNESLLGADDKYYRSGAGIFYAGYNDSYLNISGAPLISGNTNSDHADDLFIQTPITIAGPLTNTVPIGISYLNVKEPKDGSPQNFTIDWSTHMGDQKPSDYFVSNDVGIYVLPRAEKDNTEGRLGVGYTITCNPTDLSHGQIHFSPENPLFAKEEVTLTILPDPGYRLADNTLKVYKTGNEATLIEVTDNTFIMPMHPVTLSATFESTYVPPVPTYYTVTLPAVVGVTTHPAAGTHEVEEWSNFSFALTLDADYNQSIPLVKANGTIVAPLPSDGKYEINAVREDQTITIDGIVKNTPPVGNAEIETDNRIYTANGVLYIHVAQPTEAQIVTFDGSVLRSLSLPVGETTVIGLGQGIYIVRLGNGTTEKVKL